MVPDVEPATEMDYGPGLNRAELLPRRVLFGPLVGIAKPPVDEVGSFRVG